MILRNLLEGVNITRQCGPLDVHVKGIAYDSRLVRKQYLFVAVKGFLQDGHNYIKDAINRGATVIVAEETFHGINVLQCSTSGTSFIEVSDSRESLALLADAFYGHPSNKLTVIGITGTNGKTTSSYITRSIVNESGRKAGLIGTITYMTGSHTYGAANTTPESLDLQRYLSEMVVNTMDYALLEVSSHALALKRIEACRLQVAAFTNFSQDHLDFHGTMDAYFDAKKSIFRYLEEGGCAVLNHDDTRVRSLKGELKCRVLTVGTGRDADIRARNVNLATCTGLSRGRKTDNYEIAFSGTPGLSFDVETPSGSFTVVSPLIGYFNVSNILVSIAIAWVLGISREHIQQGIKKADRVDGRFERIDEGQDFLCIVDYAHTEDALRKIIETARPITKGRVITVFGCGGDRDRSKRSSMGETATELSDFVFLTTDNPRSEDPGNIIEDIVKGIRRGNYKVQIDREHSIKEAVAMAREGDTILIAGKGHEVYQEVQGKRHYFSDRDVLRREIRSVMNKKAH